MAERAKPRRCRSSSSCRSRASAHPILRWPNRSLT